VLFNFLNKNKNIKEKYIKAQISFDLSDTNEVDVNFYLSDNSESTSDSLANLLFMLNKGFFFQKMLGVLTEQGLKNPEKLILINSIITKWNNLYSLESATSEQPIIKPLGAFNANPK
jgi:hypothetical protein